MFSPVLRIFLPSKVLDVVEDLIGPNIYALSSRFWMKPGQDGSFVSWHQDSAYFGLEPNELVTVWLALTDSTPENGCVRVIPGTHEGEIYSHVETYDDKNLLARGQSIEDIDDSDAVDLVLKAGQFSCHHERIVHGSDVNDTDRMRIGVGIFISRRMSVPPSDVGPLLWSAVLTIMATGMRTLFRLRIAMQGCTRT